MAVRRPPSWTVFAAKTNVETIARTHGGGPGQGQGGQISSMSAAMLLFMLPSKSFLVGLSFSLDAASFSETKPMSDVTTLVDASIGSELASKWVLGGTPPPPPPRNGLFKSAFSNLS